jgi:oxalate decarboxylase/phosphoglucose isomerase-like protein (cupin superfamily)
MTAAETRETPMEPASRNLAIVEEQDVETQVFDWGRLRWLSEPRVTPAEKFSAGVVILEPGKGHDRHNHPGCEEILYVLSGRGRQVVERADRRFEREVGPGVLIHIPPDVYHSTVNIGDEPMRLLAIYAPPGPEAELRRMEGVVVEPPER